MSENILILPVGVVGRVDAGRLLREVEVLDQFLEQTRISDSENTPKLPKTSRLLDEIINVNKLDIMQATDRNRLLSFLTVVRSKAPMLHMSFSADPSPRFTHSLVDWLRKEIHPLVLVQLGLQPNIGAGCIVRTTNKQFDFSLKQYFKNQKGLLMQIQSLRGTLSEPSVSQAGQDSAQKITVKDESTEPSSPVTPTNSEGIAS